MKSVNNTHNQDLVTQIRSILPELRESEKKVAETVTIDIHGNQTVWSTEIDRAEKADCEYPREKTGRAGIERAK